MSTNLSLEVGKAYRNGYGDTVHILQESKGWFYDEEQKRYDTGGRAAHIDVRLNLKEEAPWQGHPGPCRGVDTKEWNHPQTPSQEKAKTEEFGISADLIPIAAIEALGRIYYEGELKYGKDNYKKGVGDEKFQRERLNHAILHLYKYASGDRSEDHLAKVLWWASMQIDLEQLEGKR